MVKLTDVARAAGVGYGTASRALSGKGPVASSKQHAPWATPPTPPPAPCANAGPEASGSSSPI